MIDLRTDGAIDAPPEAVWAIVAEDFGGLDRWFARAAKCSLLTDGPVGPDTVRLVQTGPVKVREQIVAWEPHRLLAYTIDGPFPGAHDIVTRWTLEPDDEGGVDGSIATRVRVETTGHYRSGLTGRLGGPVSRRQLATAGRLLVSGLKTEVEAAAG